MKVYFINSGLQGCYFVRCLLPLIANGWDGDQTSIAMEARTPENKSRAAQDADIIVFHRPDDPSKLEMARILKSVGKKIVYDNDDTFKDDGGFKFNEYMNKERMEKGVKRINEVLDAFVQEADLVTCSTEFLKKEYLELNPNVVVLPNCVDPFYYDEPLKNENGKIRIGVTGSVGITADMDILQPIVEHFHKDPRIEIVLFSLPPANHDKLTKEMYSNEYKFWESVNVEWQPFVNLEDYLPTLNNLRLDMMIIPRKDNYFNRCKSNIKFLEASMFEIPVIAQSFPDGQSPYEVDPEDKMHLVLATDIENWIQQIEYMIANKDFRVTLGQGARAYVAGKYDIDKRAHLWEEAYNTMYEK